ncbi:uncharacterized protein isoform X2 [Rhodnius prolixus]
MALLGSDGNKNNAQFNPKFMRDNSSKWNLSRDVDLLKHLERFSETIMRNAIIAGKCMDGLEESLTLTYLKVRDVSNVFYCVGDTQFVENRVRDEGENLHEPLEKSDIDFAECTSPANTTLEDSIATCIRLLEDRFETIQLSESDSDDEELEHSQVVVKPRKCYVERPLPHIIGSYKFLNDSTLGLSLVLHESEENTEAEDETGYMFPNIMQNNSKSLSQAEQYSASNSFSKKSREDSVNSYDMVASNECSSENYHFFSPTVYDNVEGENLDDRVSAATASQQPLLAQSKPINCYNQPGDSTSVICENSDTEKLKSKPFDKERMKSVLEQIYSSPYENILSKKKFKPDKMEVVVEPNAKAVHRMEGIEVSDDPVSTAGDNCCPTEATSASLVHDDLPNIPTRTLHSLSKNRVRNQNKRRLPSRKKRDNAGYPINTATLDREPTKLVLNDVDLSDESKKKNIESGTQVLNHSNMTSLLSPSTDEEDLFTVCNPNTHPDTSIDRLFQSLSFSQGLSISGICSQTTGVPISAVTSNEESSAFWDPFTEDEDSPLFQNTSSWSSQEFKKRPRNLLGNLDASPSDDHLFTKTNTSATARVFAPQTSFQSSSATRTSLLFDETDEDSLFSSSNRNKNNDSTKPLFNDMDDQATSSNSSKDSIFKSTNFLNDPLGFSQDDEYDSN